MAPAMLNDVDKAFLNTVSEYNLSQVELGNIAGSLAEDESLQEFGNTIALTHAKRQDELSKLAALTHHPLPVVAGAQNEEIMKVLLANKENFDSLYIHEQCIRLAGIKTRLVQEQQLGLQQDIKNYAGGLLTDVGEYIRIADSFAGKY